MQRSQGGAQREYPFSGDQRRPVIGFGLRSHRRVWLTIWQSYLKINGLRVGGGRRKERQRLDLSVMFWWRVRAAASASRYPPPGRWKDCLWPRRLKKKHRCVRASSFGLLGKSDSFIRREICTDRTRGAPPASLEKPEAKVTSVVRFKMDGADRPQQVRPLHPPIP